MHGVHPKANAMPMTGGAHTPSARRRHVEAALPHAGAAGVTTPARTTPMTMTTHARAPGSSPAGGRCSVWPTALAVAPRRDEDDGEAGDEEQRRRAGPRALGASADQLGRREARHQRQVAGHQRQHARRQEREHPGAEGHEHVRVGGGEHGDRLSPRNCGGRRSRNAAMPSATSSLAHARRTASSTSASASAGFEPVERELVAGDGERRQRRRSRRPRHRVVQACRSAAPGPSVAAVAPSTSSAASSMARAGPCPASSASRCTVQWSTIRPELGRGDAEAGVSRRDAQVARDRRAASRHRARRPRPRRSRRPERS